MSTFLESSDRFNRLSDWAPSCSLALLKERARVIATIRRFFEDRGVLEVETPILMHGGSTDPNLSSFSTHFNFPGRPSQGEVLYLQTSPEFAMKRLLAAGSGSIFQICKAFRNEEVGSFHNPEFTMLEWYRVDFSLRKLIGETEALVNTVFKGRRILDRPEIISYAEVFERHVHIDPLTADADMLAACAARFGLDEAKRLCGHDITIWLDFLFSHLVQPHLGHGRLSFVFDFPALLPSLARTKPGDHRVVERVEVYLGGMELANGFQELADADEQDRRFEADLRKRRGLGLAEPRKDDRLVMALRSGLPECAGIALGIDRLIMLVTGAKVIDDVLSFPVDRA